MSKYNEDHAREVMEWICALTGEPDNTSGDPENLYQHLRDGTLLCKKDSNNNNNAMKQCILLYEIIHTKL